MLVDESRQAAADGEVMTDDFGTCRFCNQLLTVRIPTTWDTDRKNEMATEICKCKASKNYTTFKSKVENLDEVLDSYFGHKSERKIEEDTVKLIREFAIKVLKGNVKKISMELSYETNPTEKLKIETKKDMLNISIEKKTAESAVI